MKDRNQAFLQHRPQVDEHIAATDEVEFGKGRVFHHVLFREDAYFAHAFADLIVGIHLREETAETLGRQVLDDAQ